MEEKNSLSRSGLDRVVSREKLLSALYFDSVGYKVESKIVAVIEAKTFGVGAMMAIIVGLLALALAICISPVISYSSF